MLSCCSNDALTFGFAINIQHIPDIWCKVCLIPFKIFSIAYMYALQEMSNVAGSFKQEGSYFAFRLAKSRIWPALQFFSFDFFFFLWQLVGWIWQKPVNVQSQRTPLSDFVQRIAGPWGHRHGTQEVGEIAAAVQLMPTPIHNYR